MNIKCSVRFFWIVVCFSTLCVPNARSHFWVTAITKRKAWPIARPTITNCLEICALSATRLSLATVKFLISLSIVTYPQIYLMTE